jgi:cell division septum initiation protein DivIVA
MSGQFALAVEEAKRFRQSLANVWEVLETLSKMEHPEALEAQINNLKARSSELIASYRKQAEDEAERNSKGKVEAAERKAKALLADAEEQRAAIVNKAQAQANQIIADARKAGEELTKKFEKAHQAAHAAIR